mmetsp:Transcript_12349/g.35523  ORF Transcript_12349/g.35523 Transcript_12349/m.35523 type:complete len:454 (+) Transcript_12349:46-1407(+)
MEVIVLGAGASGLSAAILLAREHGARVTVYERQLDLSQSDEESYPIGVNPRGLRTLAMVEPTMEVGDTSAKVEAWSIWEGSRRVALLPSGTVVATTRGHVVTELWRVAQQTEGVTIRMGMNLRDVDLSSSSLTFESRHDGRKADETGVVEEVVNFSGKRLLDCTGCFSKVRPAVQNADPSLGVTTTPWRLHFRNLYTAPHPAQVSLDPKVHHIFTSAGIYAAVLKGSRWVFSLSANKERDSDCDWMLAEESTAGGIERLKAHLTQHCPAALGMLEEEEYKRFFTRRTFTGQVVQLSRLHHGESILFLGDAAHSVFPATGEGINSALEDVSTLIEILASAKAQVGGDASAVHDLFASYNAARIDDSYALTEYAAFLVGTEKASVADRKRRQVAMIMMIILTKLRIFSPTWSDKSFGRLAEQRERYSVIQARWRAQRDKVEPWAERLVRCFGRSK